MPQIELFVSSLPEDQGAATVLGSEVIHCSPGWGDYLTASFEGCPLLTLPSFLDSLVSGILLSIWDSVLTFSFQPS